MAAPDSTPPWGSHSDETGLEPPSPHQLLRREAEKSLRRKQEFRTHAVVFVLVNLLLFVIWLVTAISGTGTWLPWFVFPLFGWGIGLGSHAWATYGTPPITEDRIAAEMERLRQRRLGS